MKAWVRAIRQTLEEQLQTWQALDPTRLCKKSTDLRVITLSRQAGTGGKLVATRVAQVLELQLYDRAIIQKVAKRAHTDEQVVKSRDERGGSWFEEWMQTFVRHRHLWPEKLLNHLYLRPSEYLGHLERVMRDIASTNGGVIVGRGANFILPPETCLRVRLIAPLQQRIANMATIFEVSPKVASRRIADRDSERRRFVRQHFGKDIADPEHYDLVLNLSSYSHGQAAEAIIHAFEHFRDQGQPGKP